MDGAIFLQTETGFVPMEEQAYDSEDVLQEVLADHPKLLAGDQMDEVNPRRWLLIEREARVPDSDESGGRWSADHLFVDQDGVPTIVEVKRSNDSRSRRAVVGQMMDYAAHATTYWRDGRIEAQFQRTCIARNEDPDELLAQWLPDAADIEEFWNVVESNLRAGEIRMLFVSDAIHRELKRVVEFLNEQMEVAEVLAVEVKQFAGEDKAVLVPRLIGHTEEARSSKSRSDKPPSYKEYLLDLRRRLESRDNIGIVDGELRDHLTENPRRKLTLDLPISEEIARLIAWEIQPYFDEDGSIVMRLRGWGMEDGKHHLIEQSLESVRDPLEERDFELLLHGTHFVEKTFEVEDGEHLNEGFIDSMLDEYEWFVSDVYAKISSDLT